MRLLIHLHSQQLSFTRVNIKLDISFFYLWLLFVCLFVWDGWWWLRLSTHLPPRATLVDPPLHPSLVVPYLLLTSRLSFLCRWNSPRMLWLIKPFQYLCGGLCLRPYTWLKLQHAAPSTNFVSPEVSHVWSEECQSSSEASQARLCCWLCHFMHERVSWLVFRAKTAEKVEVG